MRFGCRVNKRRCHPCADKFLDRLNPVGNAILVPEFLEDRQVPCCEDNVKILPGGQHGKVRLARNSPKTDYSNPQLRHPRASLFLARLG